MCDMQALKVGQAKPPRLVTIGNTFNGLLLTAPSHRSGRRRSTGALVRCLHRLSAWIAKCAPNGLEPTWVHHDTSAAVFLDAMAWWNSQEGLVFGDPVDSCLTLLITRDGGHSWAPTSCDLVPAHTKGEAGFAASNGNICIQGDTAWVLTGGVVSRCLKSTDRGTTWRAIDLPIRQGESMTGVFGASFSKGGKGLAIGGHWEHPKERRWRQRTNAPR